MVCSGRFRGVTYERNEDESMNKAGWFRALAYYVFAVGAIAVYGGQV
jgi:hypothetical protein